MLKFMHNKNKLQNKNDLFLGNRIIPGAMSTNMAGASLLSYRPTTQV